MRWFRSWKADPSARILADRHYNRQRVGAAQFVPPGRALVLLVPGSAFWITSAPFAEYVKHRWAGAWVNSAFRNEAPTRLLSSELILEALAASRAVLGEPPELGMVTFIDRRKVRGKRHYGYCYRMAGFEEDGYTVDEKLLALRLRPERMPPPHAPLEQQLRLSFADAAGGGQ